MGSRKEGTPAEASLAGLLCEGSGDELGKLPARIDRYSSARKRALVMVSHLQQVLHEPHLPHQPHLPQVQQLHQVVKEMQDCGNYLLFHHYYTVGKTRLAAMRSCRKHLLCPLCAIRRGAKTLKAYLDRYRVILDQEPGLRPFLVTFTVRNGDDLAERHRHLQTSLQRLHNRRRHWNKGSKSARWTEAARAEGAVWSYEVTNQGNGWHPHVHAIWLCRELPDQERLRQEWEAITGDSFMVDVRPLQQADPASGFCEVFKYAMKFSDLDPADNLQAHLTLRGRRLVGSFGVFRGVQVPEEMTDDLLPDLPYIEILYTYADRRGYSISSITEPVKADGEAVANGQP